MAEYNDNSRPDVDDPLVTEIREQFTYCVNAWRPIRDEAQKDMRYVAGDPWDPKERKAREEAGRPCLVLDELNQYTNQLINDIRQNKRAIKVVPTGAGANDKVAELRAAIIRHIEYKSNAQSAYATAFENAANRGYGYWRVSTRYTKPGAKTQELCIRRIPNPDTVLIDPDAKEADCSDARYAFVIDYVPRKEFKKRYPRAKVTDFSREMAVAAPQWIRDDMIQVAEYWKVEGKDGGYAQEGETPQVCQYLTNGIEILPQPNGKDRAEWPGVTIPIVPVFGKEIFVDKGGGTERILMSLVRLARDPYMLYCYYRTCEAEVVGMTPKTPYIGYEGQFEGHEDEWQNVNRVPIPYLQVKPLLDPTGATVLPMPQRQAYEPAIQALEMGAEAAKRAIQSSMGRYNTSVGRADTKASSGRAISLLDQQSDQGSFHFIDNFDRALEYTGRILNDLIPKIYDTDRHVGIRKADESYALQRINAPDADPAAINLDQGEYDVTISTGPSYQSQREEANIFLDTLAGVQMQNTLFPRVADLAIKAKNLGPIGDEMAKRLMPPEFAQQDGQEPLPPQAQAMLQQAQQQLQALNAYAQQMEQKLQQLEQEKQAKTLETESRERIAALQAQTQILIAEAQINGKAMLSRMEAEFEALNRRFDIINGGVAAAEPATATA